MRSLGISVVGLVCVAVIAYLAVSNEVPRIDSEIEQAANAALAAEGLDWAEVSVRDAQLTVLGKAPTRAIRPRAAEVVANIENVRNVTDRTVLRDSRPDMFQVLVEKRRSGGVVMSGHVADPRTLAALRSLASNYGETEADSVELVHVPHHEHWWAAAAIAIASLAEMEEGSVRVQGREVRVTGVVAREHLLERVSEQLARLPQGYGARVDVGLSPIPVPANALSPTDCIARIQAKLELESIEFDRGSVDIAQSVEPLMGAIAELAGRCPRTRMEISAHTGSRGDDEENLRRSQTRADAVKAALVARGLRATQFVAVGRGETMPLLPNTSPYRRERNRRVEFKLLPSSVTQ